MSIGCPYPAVVDPSAWLLCLSGYCLLLPIWVCRAMKIPLWCLLVLLPCFFTPGRSDCQGDCVACGLLLQEQQLHEEFNTMACFLECKGQVSSSLTWELCERALKLAVYPPLSEEGALLKSMVGELQMTSLDLASDSELQSAAAQPFQDENEDLDEAHFEPRHVQYDSSLLESSEAGEDMQSLALHLDDSEGAQSESGKVSEQDESSKSISLSKRFGGFQRGRHGYRKLIGSPARHLQKRYGGFIGVRKSARKWNSQKRVNQLLRQYLGMRSSRSGRFNIYPVTRVWRQNKL
ncbi:prepronociceptin b isoform X2 [Syngnathoides biaculeatus]|uniref:prepronociceptin b isoform X2 n=1 Tax=Syngnathoides biaculeatus TaxID=300417 RepID=UPI002ADE52D2|nr:prepronociceptin b isoform X2 [Syngnathoides biaculeatus]XP_061668723.1 prepronociceptin b isoform X2 [Syngnathoides biaculeatus]XP_061668724.1 prepronociceptin b isoform X2 [Syngnathoides biaculeatus]XP_061668725.1 prepronociceptin b isoform X2 [Syngnathoides biaculeatus]XP_061668726.1 prepronociceptin b isoform X2 [Syngnathoides biaculeatus]XP_061668727.1 prepronociceptin b isoform X2 [Syngnathoides biaculeatus]XP_061668728.1 prepronociceptin b isoform X2 [Syngnathoides biaculeatus]XP_0